MSMPRLTVRVAHPHVRCEPSKFGGSPYIVGTGVLVRRLWAWHRGGTSLETLIRRYPQLGPAKILDALAFAWDNQDLIEEDLAREQRMLAGEKGKGDHVGLRPMAQQILPFNGDADDDKEGSSR
jgi:uncharacterized protein (DUF433 family)